MILVWDTHRSVYLRYCANGVFFQMQKKTETYGPISFHVFYNLISVSPLCFLTDLASIDQVMVTSSVRDLGNGRNEVRTQSYILVSRWSTIYTHKRTWSLTWENMFFWSRSENPFLLRCLVLPRHCHVHHKTCWIWIASHAVLYHEKHSFCSRKREIYKTDPDFDCVRHALPSCHGVLCHEKKAATKPKIHPVISNDFELIAPCLNIFMKLLSCDPSLLGCYWVLFDRRYAVSSLRKTNELTPPAHTKGSRNHNWGILIWPSEKREIEI